MNFPLHVIYWMNNNIMTLEHNKTHGYMWKTKSGEVIPICNMTDLHLKNCANYYNKKINNILPMRIAVYEDTLHILNVEIEKRKKYSKPKALDCPFCTSKMIFQKAEDPYPEVGFSIKYQYVCECGARSNYL